MVTTAGDLDYETATSHTIEVTATSADGSTSTKEFTINVGDIMPIANNDTGVVSESGLVNGTNAGDNSNVIVGNIFDNDSGENIVVTEVNGISISGVQTIVTAQGELEINTETGDYVYTLTNPTTDVDGVEERDSFIYTLTDENGTSVSARLDITINDDAPTQAQNTNVDLHIDSVITNLSIVVDGSGSMSQDDLDLTKEAIQKLFAEYSKIGEVNINIVNFFDDDYSTTNSGWNTDLEGLTLTHIDNNLTDIEDGLRSVVEQSFDGSQPEADQTLVYFFGDGNANSGTTYETEFENYVSTWSEFVNSGTIDKLFSYSVNTSSVVDDINVLADNNENDVSNNAINITNISDLDDAILETVNVYVQGNVLNDSNGTSILNYGADGGHIESITIGNNTVNYDSLNITQDIDGLHGVYTINFETGAYTYATLEQVNHTGDVVVSITDADGDTLDSVLLTLNITHEVNRPIAVDDTYQENWSDNLVINGDAESNLSAWVIDSGSLETSSYSSNDWADADVENSEDGNYFYGANSDLVEVHQDIDISSISGSEFKLSADMGSYASQTDSSELRVIFKDINGNALAEMTTGEVVTESSMIYKEVQGTLPVVAVTATVIMLMHRDQGSDADGYFDNISLLIGNSANDNLVTDEDISFDIDSSSLLSNDVSVDNTLTVTAVSATDETHGTVILSGGVITFIPQGNYEGEASFEYTISDADGNIDTATVVLNVNSDGDDTEAITLVSATDGADSIVLDGLDSLVNTLDGNDYIDAGLGSDTVDAGLGNDTIVFDSNDIVIDGGEGGDTLVLQTSDSINFDNISNIANIETIDLNINGDHSLENISASDVFNMTDDTNSLTILGDTNDSITLANPSEWSSSTSSENGHDFTIYTSLDNELITLKIETDIPVV